QLSHEVKRVDLVNRLREVLHALPDPLRPVAVDDHHGILVDIIQRVHEPARQPPEIPGLCTEVTLVHQAVLATGRMARRPALMHRQQLLFHPPLTAFPLQWHAEAIHFQEQHSHLARPRWRLQLLGLLLHQPLAHRQHHLPDALVADHPVSVQGLQTAGRSPIAVGQHRLPQGPRGQGRTQLLLGRQLQHFVKQVHHLARLPIQVSSAAKREVDAKQRLQRAWLHVPHAKATPVPLFGQPIVDLLQGLHQHIGKLVSHPREKSGLQFLQGKAELLAKFVHDEKPLPVVFLADTTRSEDRLLVPSFSSPAPRALPPGAFTARAPRPFHSHPHHPPQSGRPPVRLPHNSQHREGAEPWSGSPLPARWPWAGRRPEPSIVTPPRAASGAPRRAGTGSSSGPRAAASGTTRVRSTSTSPARGAPSAWATTRPRSWKPSGSWPSGPTCSRWAWIR